MDVSSVKDVVQIIVGIIGIVGVPIGIYKFIVNKQLHFMKDLEELSIARTELAKVSQNKNFTNSYIDDWDIAKDKYLSVLEKVSHKAWTKKRLELIMDDLYEAKHMIGVLNFEEPFLDIKKAIKKIENKKV